MQVLPFDYQTGKAADRFGLARTAALISQARREAQNTVLLDNGDFLCGSDAGIVAGLSLETSHPMISVMNHLGYDAGTLGNHDFDYGLAFLMNTTAQADFPHVSANALRTRGGSARADTPLVAPFTILERQVSDILGFEHRLRIGITGFLPPHSISQIGSDTQQVETRDILEAARYVVPQMKAAGADIIIVLAHTGIAGETHVHNMENAVIPLAGIAGIDAIISGHGHRVFPGPDWPESAAVDATRGLVNGVPVVAPGFWGSHLGLIDLELSRRNGDWQVKSTQCEARPIFATSSGGTTTACVETDHAISAIIKPLHKRILKEINEPVGKTSKPLNSFFALLAPTRAIQEIQHAQLWCARSHFKGCFDPDLPLLSSACSFKAGGFGGAGNYTNIAPGTVSMRSIVDLYPFPNQVALLQINGDNLREWLERSASIFTQVRPNTAAHVHKPADIPGYLFESVLGVEYEIDLSQPARYNQTGQIINPNAHRIKHLTYAGRAVTQDQEFTLITNNYRIGGGGFYPSECLKRRLDVPVVELQQLLPEYFRQNPDPSRELLHHWHFSPVKDAKILVYTSPLALDHMEDLHGFNISPLTLAEDGFQPFEVTL